MQMLGLLILPIAVAGNVLEKLSLKESLQMSGFGITVFTAGWLLQQAGRKG